MPSVSHPLLRQLQRRPRARQDVGADPALRTLGQYPTPCWVAEALLERYFPDLDGTSRVLEPTCGPGSFLGAIPAHVPAWGVELDPAVAEVARALTGRPVLDGDIRDVSLPFTPTHVIGNPPFRTAIIDAILDRAYAWLPEGGRVGMILPVHAFQTAGRVAGYAQRWSLEQTLLPRNIYPNLKTPLCFGVFSRDRRRLLVGFALYRETAAVQRLAPATRMGLEHGLGGEGSVWRQVIDAALEQLGGQAPIQAIYDVIEGRRPTRTRFWREQIRKHLQANFVRVERGVYARPTASLAA